MHAALQLRRDACYRELALAILGPDAPTNTADLVVALRAHAHKPRPEAVGLPQAA